MAKHNLLNAGLLLSLALMAGRLTGLVRELMLASTFGATEEADMAIILLTLPDLLSNLLLSGGLSIALIPAIRQAATENRNAIVGQASLVVFIFFSILGLLFAAAPQWWFTVLAPGLAIQSNTIHYWTLLLLSAAIPLTALSGVTSAALQSENRFFIAGCGTLVFNLCVIAALYTIAITPSKALLLLCTGVVIGSLLRWGSQWAIYRIHYGQLIPLRSLRWLITSDLIKIFLTGLTAASLLILVPVCIRAAASWLGNGQLSIFNYAIKLVELPLGVLITALATVLYPVLSQAFVDKNDKQFSSTLKTAISKSLVLSTAIVLCGWHFSDSIVRLLFGFDRLSEGQRKEISQLTQIAILAVPWIGIASLMTAALNASNQSKQVLRYTLVALLTLPLLLAPGLILESGTILMTALPFFYILLALLLCHSSREYQHLPSIRLTLKILILQVLLFLPFWLLDIWAQPLFIDLDVIYTVTRLVYAFVIFGLIVYMGLKMLHITSAGDH